VLYSDLDESQGEPDPETRGLTPIEPVSSGEGYADMEDFIAQVRDPRARDLLRARDRRSRRISPLQGHALRLPELRQAWFAFHDARMQGLALEWLADQGLVDREATEAALPGDPELPELSGPFDPFEIARAVAEGLRGLYGDRLRRVLLFGSWARGDAHPESDIDLLVVLDRVDSAWEERKRMDEILNRHSVANETVVSAMPTTEEAIGRRNVATLIRAIIEGRAVA